MSTSVNWLAKSLDGILMGTGSITVLPVGEPVGIGGYMPVPVTLLDLFPMASREGTTQSASSANHTRIEWPQASGVQGTFSHLVLRDETLAVIAVVLNTEGTQTVNADDTPVMDMGKLKAILSGS
jgi:hypothetical protein